MTITKVSVSFLLMLSCCGAAFSQVRTGDVLFDMLRSEVRYYYERLSRDTVPVQFISFNAMDEKAISIESDMGSSSLHEFSGRKFYPTLSFGEYKGEKPLNQFDFSGSDRTDSQVHVVDLPLDNDTSAIKDVVWNTLGRMYRGSVAVWRKILQQSLPVCDVDRGLQPAEYHYEEPYPEAHVDKAGWKGILNDVTSSCKAKSPQAVCKASLEFRDQRRYVVTSDGTAVVCNRRAYTLALSATVKDDKGEEIPMTKVYFGYDESELPDRQALLAGMDDLVGRAEALSRAPMAEAYSGPVLLSGNASAVFFHEILGHRLERKDSELRPMQGTLLMSPDISVSCNPGLKSFKGIPLSGHYSYDDDGTMGGKVECISQGMVKGFLGCRSSESGGNGHGRANFGEEVQPRQSNLIVETSRPYTESQLRGMFVAELKKQNREYGYYISSVSNGWTVQGGSNSVSSFNVVPLETYRVYADGRPDELVRGVSLIGTPLTVFGNIMAAGDRQEVFNGTCGSRSGWIPVSCVAPMLYVSQVETQRIKDRRKEPATQTSKALSGYAYDGEDVPDSVIFRAMGDELSLASANIVDADGRKPLFIEYNVCRNATTRISSSLGTCLRYAPEGIRNIGLVHVIAGDRLHTSYGQSGVGKPFALPDEISYPHIRQKLGMQTEAMFRRASLGKRGQRQQTFIDANLPEWLELPGDTLTQESALDNWADDAERLKSLADTLSMVFKSYPMLSETHVEIVQSYNDYYRATSEGLRARFPHKNVRIEVYAKYALPKGTALDEIDVIEAYDVADLPPVDSLVAYVEAFARKTIVWDKAECPEEMEYIGPVLCQNSAVMLALANENNLKNNLCTYIHSHFSPMSREYDNSYRMIGKKVVNNSISMWQLGNDSLYDGHRLLRYRKYDADGVRPKTVELVRNGVLQNQLSGRVPSPGAVASTGNEFMDERWKNWGMFNNPTRYTNSVLRITCSKTMSNSRLKRELRRLAKRQGLEYAYILKDKAELTRVNVKTGREEILRAYCSANPSRLELMGDMFASKNMTASLSRSIIYPQSVLLPMTVLEFRPRHTCLYCERFAELRH